MRACVYARVFVCVCDSKKHTCRPWHIIFKEPRAATPGKDPTKPTGAPNQLRANRSRSGGPHPTAGPRGNLHSVRLEG